MIELDVKMKKTNILRRVSKKRMNYNPICYRCESRFEDDMVPQIRFKAPNPLTGDMVEKWKFVCESCLTEEEREGLEYFDEKYYKNSGCSKNE